MPGGAMGKPVMAKSQGWLLLFLLLWLLKPGMADRWVCWWRLRYWQGVLHFVHPGGWYEPLSAWDEVAIQALFVEEPEMAEYVAGNSYMPDGGLSPFPPYWQPSPGSWQISRTLEDANWKRVWVARPVNLEEHGPPGQPPPRASDGYTGSEAMRATGMGWVPGNEARDGSRRDPCFQASDGCGGASSSSRPSRSPSRGRSFVCSWERERQARDGSGQARDGSGQASDGSREASDGSTPAGVPLPANPYRYIDRGWHSHQRRLARRELKRSGQSIPDELLPRRVEMSKQLKKHMFALQWAARRMASADLDEEELSRIEAQMQDSCEQPLDAGEEPELAAVPEEEAMDVDEEEEESPLEVEVKTDKQKARDGSKTKSRSFYQMRSSKGQGTPNAGGEQGNFKNDIVKEEKPEMAPEDAKAKKKKKPRRSKTRSPSEPKGPDHDRGGGPPPPPPPPPPPAAEAVPAT